MTKNVFAKQVSENTYKLVDIYGSSCDRDGNLAYHPVFFSGRAEESEWPIYEEKENKNEHLDR